MPTPDLVKLAPNLSAKERFKIIIPDLHRALMGEKQLLSESERQAITHFENRAVWEEYTRRIGIMQWADTFWTDGIETEKLRAFACYLLLGRAVDRLVTDADMPLPDDMRDALCANIREHVDLFEKNSTEFYAYREATVQVERELYGMPLFNEKKKEVIASYYESVDEMFENYNNRIRMICKSKMIQKRINPLAEHPESYVAKKPIPQKELVDELVDGIMRVVDSEMEMLGR